MGCNPYAGDRAMRAIAVWSCLRLLAQFEEPHAISTTQKPANGYLLLLSIKLFCEP
jgi:hypothetical protein